MINLLGSKVAKLLVLSCIGLGVGLLMAWLSQPVCRIDWPITERDNGRLMLDGRSLELGSENPIEVTLFSSNSELVAQRKGFEPVSISIDQVSWFSRLEKKLKWQPTKRFELQQRYAELVAEANRESSRVSGGVHRELVNLAVRNAEATGARKDKESFAQHLEAALAQVPHPLKRKVFADRTSSDSFRWSIGSNHLRHAGPVRHLSFSPDGKWIASGAEDSVVKIHDAKTGEFRFAFNEHRNGVNALAFHPDSKLVASADYRGNVFMWDFQSDESWLLAAFSGSVSSIGFSPDGERLAVGGANRELRTFDVSTKQCDFEFSTSGTIEDVHFSFDSNEVIVLTPQVIQVVGIEEQSQRMQIDVPHETNRIGLIQKKDVELAAFGPVYSTHYGFDDGKKRFAYESTTKIVSQSRDKTWLAESQSRGGESRIKLHLDKETTILPLGKRIPGSADVTADKTVAAVGTIGGGIYLFRLDVEPFELTEPSTPEINWRRVQFDRPGSMMGITASNGAVVVYDCFSRKSIMSIPGKGLPRTRMVFAEAVNQIWCESDIGLEGFSIDDPNELQQVGDARSVCTSVDGSKLAYVKVADSKTKLVVRDLVAGNEEQSIEIKFDVKQLLFAQSGDFLFSVDAEGRILRYVLADQSMDVLYRPDGDASKARMIAHAGLEQVVASFGSRVARYDLASFELVNEFEIANPVEQVEGSPIGSRWFCRTKSSIHGFEGNEKTFEKTLFAQNARLSDLSATIDGRFFAVGNGESQIQVFDATQEKQRIAPSDEVQ